MQKTNDHQTTETELRTTITKVEDSTILITGATDGLGKDAAYMLASQGAHLVLHGRNPEKTQMVVETLQEETKNYHIESVLADFSSLSHVRQMATEIKSRSPRLDVLINNAGIFPTRRQFSMDGFELTFTVNYLAPFLLTNLLRPLLIESTPARIINLSSVGHCYVWLNPNDLQGEHFYWSWVAYCRSKLLMILFNSELARQLKDTGVTSNALHPGLIPGTSVTNNAWIRWGTTREEGAKTIVNLATNPEINGITGAYFSRFDISKPNPQAGNIALQQKLWRQSLIWTGLPAQT